jgi:hypothetical protein
MIFVVVAGLFCGSGMEPRTLHMLGKHATTKLNPLDWIFFLFFFWSGVEGMGPRTLHMLGE